MPEGHQFTNEEIYRLFGVTDEEREAFLGSLSNEAYMRARQQAKAQLDQLREEWRRKAETVERKMLEAGVPPGMISMEPLIPEQNQQC